MGGRFRLAVDSRAREFRLMIGYTCWGMMQKSNRWGPQTGLPLSLDVLVSACKMKAGDGARMEFFFPLPSGAHPAGKGPPCT